MSKEESILVFGDVHGEAGKLKKLIAYAKDKYNITKIYSTGDLIDRGEGVKEVIQACIDEGVEAVSGNHELWLVDFIKDGAFYNGLLHPIMGAEATIKSYVKDYDGTNKTIFKLKDEMPEGHKEYILNMPDFIKFESGGETFLLNHAGVKKNDFLAIEQSSNGLSEEQILDLITKHMRNSFFWSRAYRTNIHEFEGCVQIFGHSIFEEPILERSFIALDTGSGTKYPNKLTGLLLPQHEFIQV